MGFDENGWIMDYNFKQNFFGPDWNGSTLDLCVLSLKLQGVWQRARELGERGVGGREKPDHCYFTHNQDTLST